MLSRRLSLFGFNQRRFSPKSEEDCTSEYMKDNGIWDNYYQWTPSYWQLGTQRNLKVNYK